MNKQCLESILARLPRARLAVMGDFCLDAYWTVDSSEHPPSLETGLDTRCVRTQRYTLGGAGNVVANLLDLGVKQVQAIGLMGDDLFGAEMLRILQRRGVDTSGMLPGGPTWQTAVYAKPYTDGIEANRIDFGFFNTLADPVADALLAALTRAARSSDVVILNQQIPAGVCSASLIERINTLISTTPGTRYIVDARNHAGLFRGAILKLNAREASRLLGMDPGEDPYVSPETSREYARRLQQRTGQPIFLTRGENGIVAADADDVNDIPGIQIVDQTDPVGAGDTAVSALAAALAVGASAREAATLANIAASITVRKLQTTGTATPEEIRAVGPDPDYVYLPELATDPRQARFHASTEIEIVSDLPSHLQIQHAIFDHDGTLSTLREGWESIMHPMMVRAILGPCYQSADPGLYAKATRAVATFIDKTTGIQTLVQMQGLVQLVRQFGCVPAGEILDEHGYKRIYNEQLLEMVRGRVRKLEAGELDASDFQIKNAARLLQALHDRGVKLYLASGTDEADVIAEATAMGYANLFEGRIYGAVGNVNVEAKKVVLERIMREHNLRGHQLATFGDGPVEIRETRKRDGICVGVASDETRRFSLNPAKRTRLIRAGASLIIPDYSQLAALLNVLRL